MPPDWSAAGPTCKELGEPLCGTEHCVCFPSAAVARLTPTSDGRRLDSIEFFLPGEHEDRLPGVDHVDVETAKYAQPYVAALREAGWRVIAPVEGGWRVMRVFSEVEVRPLAWRWERAHGRRRCAGDGCAGCRERAQIEALCGGRPTADGVRRAPCRLLRSR